MLKNTGVNAESLQFRRWRPQRCTETCQAGRERWGRRTVLYFSYCVAIETLCGFGMLRVFL